MTIAHEILFPLDDPDHIALQVGAPDKSLLPADLLQFHSNKTLSSSTASLSLQYGPSLGSLGFRHRLANWLSQEYNGSPVDPSHLCVTSGASQSFLNLLTIFTHSGTRFLIENPTYFLALRMFQDSGISTDQLIKIPVDDDGIRVDIVQKELETLDPVPASEDHVPGETKRFPFFLFLVPTYSNPTGTSLSVERRQKLIQLARKHDMLIVCDDVYQLLHYDNVMPPHRLVSLDLETASPDVHFGNVISNCSFSKLFAPGMRLGWIEAGQGIIAQLKNAGFLYSGGCANHFVSNVMGSVIESGDMARHVHRIRGVYQGRRDVMLQVLKAQLNHIYQVSFPQGGYFIWITSGDKSLDTLKLLQALQKGPAYRGVQYDASCPEDYKVSFTPGNLFSSDASHGHCLRLSFGMYGEADLIKGCERLCKILNKVV